MHSEIKGNVGAAGTTTHDNTMQAITYRVYRRFEDSPLQQEQWDSFVESVGGDIYSTYDWCRIWWQYYSYRRELRIHLFYRQERLVGIIPAFCERLWLGPIWLRLAKVISADSAAGIVHPPVEAECATEIYQLLISSLLEEDGCDGLCLGPIGEDYASFASINKAIENHPRLMILEDFSRSVYTSFKLPETFEDYVQSLNKRQRGNLRRDLNLINRSFSLEQDAVRDEKASSAEFKSFAEMHSDQWKAEGKLGHFDDWPKGHEFNAKMVQEQAKLDRLRLVRLKADGQVVSYQLCFEFAGRWHWRLPARLVGKDWHRYGLGRIGLIKQIEMAIDEGVREIEAGSGQYPYKVKLGGDVYSLHTLVATRSNTLCRWRATLFMKLALLLNLFYYRLWFCRFAPKLPFRRRPLWRLWIRTRV